MVAINRYMEHTTFTTALFHFCRFLAIYFQIFCDFSTTLPSPGIVHGITQKERMILRYCRRPLMEPMVSIKVNDLDMKFVSAVISRVSFKDNIGVIVMAQGHWVYRREFRFLQEGSMQVVCKKIKSLYHFQQKLKIDMSFRLETSLLSQSHWKPGMNSRSSHDIRILPRRPPHLDPTGISC